MTRSRSFRGTRRPRTLRYAAAMVGCLALAAAQAAVPEDSMAQRMAACTGCHGEQGRAAQDGYYPRIAGKPAGYLYRQLRNFRDGRRQYAPMVHIVANLPDAYLLEIAQFFADQHPPYAKAAAPSAAAEVLAAGERLVSEGDRARGVPACRACHGQRLTGVEPDIPGLVGLPPDYLSAQLGSWRNGSRRGPEPDCMAQVVERLTPEQASAAVAWLAQQPVPEPSAPAVTLTAPLPLACGAVSAAADAAAR